MFNDYEVELYEKEHEQIQEIIKDNNLIPIKLEDLKDGQTVLINFWPFSQRYIYYLIPKLGKIVHIPDTNDLYDYKIQSYKSNVGIESLFHPNVSYYGDSLGYDWDIKLVENFNL